MKKTLKEKILFQLMGFGKKNRWLRYPVLVCIFFVCWFSSMIHYLHGNLKRFVSIAVVFLFFALSSSFSFPAFENKNMEIMKLTTFASGNQETVDKAGYEEEKEAPIELLDDFDVIDGYEDSDINAMDHVTKYTLDEILEENESSIDDAVAAAETETVQGTEFDKNDWRYVLINKQHPIPEDYTVNLGTIKGSMKCDARIIDELLLMLQAAKKDGVNLVICSPYRDMNRQKVLFERKINAYMKKGMSYMDAYKTASQAVTVPGASEHQIGLALDIVTDTYTTLNEGFGDTAAGEWLAEHCCEYGFILRYPKGKEYITSIEYEPWHFRYVGKEAATVIMQQGITLEEFVESL